MLRHDINGLQWLPKYAPHCYSSTFARPCHEVAHGTIFWFIWACPKKMEYLNIIIFPDSNCHMTDPYIIPTSSMGISNISWFQNDVAPMTTTWWILNGPHLQCRRVVNAHMECTAFGQLRSTRQFLGGDGHGVTNVLPPSESSVDFEPNMENGSI